MPLDPTGEDYHRAFEVFLSSTDQKAVAADYLTSLVGRLPHRGSFIDVGAGGGDTTCRIAEHFERTIAVEPNESMHARLRRTCPDVELMATTVDAANIVGRADLVLCAHVLYYVPVPGWVEITQRMLSWVAGGGELVLTLQNPDSDCMRMVSAFTGVRYELASLTERIRSDATAPGVEITLDTVPAAVRTAREADALTIAEFMLNLAPLKGFGELPRLDDLRTYVRDRFTDQDGQFRFTCDQDFLRVRLPDSASRRGRTQVSPAH